MLSKTKFGHSDVGSAVSAFVDYLKAHTSKKVKYKCTG